MKRKSTKCFFLAILCLIIGAAFHGLRMRNESTVLFTIGVGMGILMLLSFAGFLLTGIVLRLREQKNKEDEP